MERPARLLSLSLILILASFGSAAAQVTLFDGTFSRGTGEPVTAHATFTATTGPAILTLDSGGVEHDTDRRVSSATIRLNGITVLRQMQFNQEVTSLETIVDLRAVNELEVLLAGKPGGAVAIRVVWPVRGDIEGISAVWDRLEKLFATAQPSAADLTAWFESNVATDFVNNGLHHAEQLAEMIAIANSGMAVGMTFSPTITRPIDVSATSYAKGYEIRLDYGVGDTTASVLTSMAFDGSRWLWYGDQKWVEADLMSYMSMTVPFDRPVFFQTGLAITLWDHNDSSSYQHGARSAIVTGPGLPAGGRTLYHMYPLAYFRLYPSENPAGDFYVLLDDDTIRGIPEGAEYTIRLYSEAPDAVSLADTPLTSFVHVNPRPPLLNTELNASLFPTLVSPLTHNSSGVGVGGPVEVHWTNPSEATVGYVSLSLTEDSLSFRSVSAEVTPGATSVVLDTTVYPSWRAGGLYLSASDTHGRNFSLHWAIYPWQ